jgi:hypothetical protein
VDRFDNINVLGEEHNGYTAQQCALIAVDEIIKNNEMLGLLTQDTMRNTWFWNEVKQEIENL